MSLRAFTDGHPRPQRFALFQTVTARGDRRRGGAGAGSHGGAPVPGQIRGSPLRFTVTVAPGGEVVCMWCSWPRKT